MLAEQRRRGPDRGRRRGRARTAADLRRPAEHRVLDLDGHLPGAARGEANAVGDVVDRAGRDVGRLERREPLARSPARRSARRSVGISSTRFSTRSPFVANRGSSASAGSPSARQKRGHWRSLPTATAIVAVGRLERLVRDDVRVGVAEPARGDAVDERVLGLVDEHRRASIRRSTRRSAGRVAVGRATSGRSRPASAARIADRAVQPGQRRRLIATPTFVGPPPSASVAPVIDISPDSAWMTKS